MSYSDSYRKAIEDLELSSGITWTEAQKVMSDLLDAYGHTPPPACEGCDMPETNCCCG